MLPSGVSFNHGLVALWRSPASKWQIGSWYVLPLNRTKMFGFQLKSSSPWMVLTHSRYICACRCRQTKKLVPFAQTIAAGRVAVLPANAWVGGVTPRSSTVTIRVSAKVGLQVCQRILLWCHTVKNQSPVSDSLSGKIVRERKYQIGDFHAGIQTWAGVGWWMPISDRVSQFWFLTLSLCNLFLILLRTPGGKLVEA